MANKAAVIVVEIDTKKGTAVLSHDLDVKMLFAVWAVISQHLADNEGLGTGQRALAALVRDTVEKALEFDTTNLPPTAKA